MAAIIFDFDGTIADSFDYIVDLLDAAAHQPPLSADDRAELRGMSMAAIGRQFGLPWLRLFRLFFSGRRSMTAAMNHIEPFEGMPDLLEKLHAEGHELFILSSNSVQNVRKFLHRHDLHKYFLQIYGGVGLFGKAPSLRRLLREQNLHRDQVIYIGDELRDVQAAQAIDLRVIAVTWGFARPSALADLQPTNLVASPAELLGLLEEL